MVMMKLFPHYWFFEKGIHLSLVGSPHKELVMQSFDVFFVASLTKLLNDYWSCQCFEMPGHSFDHYIMIGSSSSFLVAHSVSQVAWG